MDISSINEVLVKLQHIQTDVSTQTRAQMVDDGELRSACDRLRVVCFVVNRDLERILGSFTEENEDNDSDSCLDEVPPSLSFVHNVTDPPYTALH